VFEAQPKSSRRSGRIRAHGSRVEDSGSAQADPWGALAATADRAAATRVRVGALRLWSRARDVARGGGRGAGSLPAEREAEFAAARSLVGRHGSAAFAPAPAPSDDALLADLEELLYGLDMKDDGAGDLEIEAADSTAAAEPRAESPEAAYLELLARSPAHGATLFACRATRVEEPSSPAPALATQARAGPLRWLAISRRGAAVLSADAKARLHDVPLECARRWCAAPGTDLLRFDYERPPHRWPVAFARRTRDPAPLVDDDGAAAAPAAADDGSWVSSTLFGSTPTKGGGAPADRAPRRPAPRADGALDGDAADVPSMRVNFELEVDGARGAPGGAPEACALLDDYALCDLAETPPVFSWETPDALGRTSRDRRNQSRAAGGDGADDEPLTAMGGFYDALVMAVVRPPRFEYDARLLGPSSFTFGGKRYHRHDVVLRNDRGQRLHCSHWRPTPTRASGPDAVSYRPQGGPARKSPLPTKKVASPADATPCVVFVHANSASRAQSCHYLSLVLSLGCSLFAFDCAGSGLSDGAYVTLGWREARDIRVVLRWLSARHDVSAVSLWGQSMGAAAAIYYQGIARPKDPSWPKVSCVVLDSPYSDFGQLATRGADSDRRFGGPPPNFRTL